MDEKQDVACAVIVRNGMILATCRGANVSHAGRWEFPGGKPKEGESADKCVVRRVNEELGLEIAIRDTIEPYEVVSRENKHFVMHPFIVEMTDGHIRLENHDRAEWFLPIQLMQLAWPPTNTPIIDEIVQRIITKGCII